MTTSNMAATTNSTNSTTPSFYKRRLPETCVAFASNKGKQLFSSAMANNGLKSFFSLIQQFTTQTEPAYCGLTTLVLVLNALSVDPHQTWKGPWRWYEERMLNCCVDLEDIKNKGITLRDFQCLAHCQGLSVDLMYCDDSSTLDGFRSAVQRACTSSTNEQDLNDNDNDDTSESEDVPQDILVVSYSRKVLSQTGSGHFSPIAAYDSASDSVLILDTARFKYGAHWTKLPLIYEAMKPIDPDAGKSRGYALLSFAPQPSPQENTGGDEHSAIQPMSILFRSRLNQNPERRRYKEYLESLPGDITWKEVCDYWSGEDTKGSCVWSILEPLRVAPDGREENNGSRTNVRSLVDELLGTIDQSISKCCGSAQEECQCVTKKETLFFIYLGSISKERRTDLVMNFASNASRLTRELLLNEAELIATAIACSEESSSF